MEKNYRARQPQGRVNDWCGGQVVERELSPRFDNVCQSPEIDLTWMARLREMASSRDGRHRLMRALVAVLLAVLPLARAFAADLSGTYRDGPVGRSQGGGAAVLSGRLEESHLVSRVMPGLGSIAVLGANSTVFLSRAGPCSVNHSVCSLQPLRPDRSDKAFSSIAWAQFELSSWALPARYKRFIEASGAEFLGGGLKENHLVFRLTAAPRPLSLLGVEFARIDLGHSIGHFGGFPTDTSMKGTAVFGVLHLPLPSSAIDVYTKAGFARLTSALPFAAYGHGARACSPNDLTCSPQPFVLNRIDTRFAGAAGAQIKLGSVALRAEYKQFIAAGGCPGVLSIEFRWNFL